MIINQSINQQDITVPWVADFYYLFKVQKQSLDWVAWVGSILGTAGEVFSCSEGSLKDYIIDYIHQVHADGKDPPSQRVAPPVHLEEYLVPHWTRNQSCTPHQ